MAITVDEDSDTFSGAQYTFPTGQLIPTEPSKEITSQNL